jgi:uncharacterized membrane protein
MDAKVRELAETLLNKGYDDLPEREQRVLHRIAERAAISRNVAVSEASTLGERVADRVAAFGGSWTFIFLFLGVLVAWVGMNTWAAAHAPDPFPFIFLNLILSMVAALQAPVIMMSQNRQTEKDREAMAHDYEVNLKAELEIMSLHDKIDALRLSHLDGRLDEIMKRLEGIEAGLRR